MKCTYYSYYPYERKDFDKERLNDRDYSIPFKLIETAVCEEPTTMESAEEEFVEKLFEDVLDRPDCKGIEDYNEPYELFGVKVTHNKNFIGATNEYDGIFVFQNGNVYAIDYDTDGCVRFFGKDPLTAMMFCYRHNTSGARMGYLIDTRLETIDEHNSRFN